MPRLLPQRLAEDSIREFVAAAKRRDKEADALLMAGHRTAAIYMWGYVAEMTLKAAWFGLLGIGENQFIGMRDLDATVQVATTQYGIVWPRQERLHNVFCWSQLLTQHRIATAGGYPDRRFAGRIIQAGQRIQARWRVQLRYKRNHAYWHEIEAVQTPAKWLLCNLNRL